HRPRPARRARPRRRARAPGGATGTAPPRTAPPPPPGTESRPQSQIEDGQRIFHVKRNDLPRRSFQSLERVGTMARPREDESFHFYASYIQKFQPLDREAE